MKLISSTPEAALEAVRAISEGRGERRFLLALPLREFTAAPAPPRERHEILLPPVRKQRLPQGTSIADALDLFKQHIGGDEFTAAQCGQFMSAAGWTAREPDKGATQKLRKLYFTGDVDEVRRERVGMGTTVFFKFPAND